MISHFWRPSTDYTRPASPSFNILKYPSTDQQQKHSKIFFIKFFCFLVSLAFIVHERDRLHSNESDIEQLLARSAVS